MTLAPLRDWRFVSRTFLDLQRHFPDLRLPLPDLWVRGLDVQSFDAQPEKNVSFLLGRVLPRAVWYYYPLALLFKWPLGFLGALAVRTRLVIARRHRGAFLAVPVLLYLLSGMFFVSLNAGIRYLFLLLPFLCVWLGGLASPRVLARAGTHGRLWLRVGLALAVLQSVEAGLAAPWYLSFFNWPAGGPGGGYLLVNDSNVDWGQGLIALRDELKKRGIRRVNLAYHGTTDPAIYGIDYVPYLGGEPGRQSDWLAISSYYLVGLGQRMMTQRGRTPPVGFDFHRYWGLRPTARPADCIYLFPLRGAGLARVSQSDRDVEYATQASRKVTR
jgi:hypothetical protein